jgi:excinuclease ABC subunit B
MYADTITDSMRVAIDETTRRRTIQQAFNEEHGITPQTIKKAIADPLVAIVEADYVEVPLDDEPGDEFPDPAEIPALVERLRKDMRRASAELEFERAAELRDRIQALERHRLGLAAEQRGG